MNGSPKKGVFFFNTMKVNKVECCFGPHIILIQKRVRTLLLGELFLNIIFFQFSMETMQTADIS